MRNLKVINGSDRVVTEYALENQELRSKLNDVQIELDRMGAPRYQDSGFSYNPVGRLKRLTTDVIGKLNKSKMFELKAEIMNLRRQVATLKKASKQET